jgi:hypothetical protein
MKSAHVPGIVVVEREVEFNIIHGVSPLKYRKVLKISKTVKNDGEQGLPNSSYCGIITCEGKICKLFAKLAKEKMLVAC